jgi:hypothetical protein
MASATSRTHSVFTELQIQLADAEAGQALHTGRQKFLLGAKFKRERNYFISFQRGVTSDGQQGEIKIKTNFCGGVVGDVSAAKNKMLFTEGEERKRDEFWPPI